MKPNVNGRGLKWLFTAAMLLALFTGFSNMPLYGRYYIANIPGFQWSGNFIVNMKVHLGTALLFTAVGVVSLVVKRKTGELDNRQ